MVAKALRNGCHNGDSRREEGRQFGGYRLEGARMTPTGYPVISLVVLG